MAYCMYLRKSRADWEAEARGEGETFARHRKQLFALAKQLQIQIEAVYEELISGDSIAARPIMQQLLAEVETGKWQGVLVMEIDRLARGDSIDQGQIARIFQYSQTKIITPLKIFDPSNEFDHEYFEFGLFMSRREYQTINRRLQRGRIAAVKEGLFIGGQTPYGYARARKNGKPTLSVLEEEAAIVRLIFSWYVSGISEQGILRPAGGGKIAQTLNQMGIPSKRGGKWAPETIYGILKNPVYIGKVRWKWRPCEKQLCNGKVITHRPLRPETAIFALGMHPPIVSESMFFAAQKKRKKYHAPLNQTKQLKNPLAGLLRCQQCGRVLIRKCFGAKEMLVCPNVHCQIPPLSLKDALQHVLSALSSLSIQPSQTPSASTFDLSAMRRQTLHQLSRIHELLEQDIYSPALFQKRQAVLLQRLHELEKISPLAPLALSAHSRPFPAWFHSLSQISHQNLLLKAVFQKITYSFQNGRIQFCFYPKLSFPHA